MIRKASVCSWCPFEGADCNLNKMSFLSSHRVLNLQESCDLLTRSNCTCELFQVLFLPEKNYQRHVMDSKNNFEELEEEPHSRERSDKRHVSSRHLKLISNLTLPNTLENKGGHEIHSDLQESVITL